MAAQLLGHFSLVLFHMYIESFLTLSAKRTGGTKFPLRNLLLHMNHMNVALHVTFLLRAVTTALDCTRIPHHVNTVHVRFVSPHSAVLLGFVFTEITRKPSHTLVVDVS